jgi:hypothetical protein
VRPGRHAAGDGSFGRSAGTQTVRGAALLGIAVLIGVILLRTAPSETVSSVKTTKTTTRTTAKPAASGVTVPQTTTTAAPRQPAQITVTVANGTNVSGAAQRIKSQLLQSGYNVVSATNATSTTNATTTVSYLPGFQQEAVILATSLSLPATAAAAIPPPPPVSDTKGADLVVVVGADLASQLSSASGPPATSVPAPTSPPHTTTTVRHTTTTLSHVTTTTKKP